MIVLLGSFCLLVRLELNAPLITAGLSSSVRPPFANEAVRSPLLIRFNIRLNVHWHYLSILIVRVAKSYLKLLAEIVGATTECLKRSLINSLCLYTSRAICIMLCLKHFSCDDGAVIAGMLVCSCVGL